MIRLFSCNIVVAWYAEIVIQTILFEEIWRVFSRRHVLFIIVLHTLTEVAAIPKLRMVWWFVHAITCAMAIMAVGSCFVAEARQPASPSGASTWELEKMWKVISPWNSRLADEGHCSWICSRSFYDMIVWNVRIVSRSLAQVYPVRLSQDGQRIQVGPGLNSSNHVEKRWDKSYLADVNSCDGSSLSRWRLRLKYQQKQWNQLPSRSLGPTWF